MRSSILLFSSAMSDAEAKAPRFGPDEMRDFLVENGGRIYKDIDDDNRIDIGYFLIGLQILFFILYGVFTKYGDSAAGRDPEGSIAEQMKYPQFQDVHVMIFLGFGMLMLFLKWTIIKPVLSDHHFPR